MTSETLSPGSGVQEKALTDVALVTGGGTGVGRDIALQLAEALPVIIVGRNRVELDKTVQLGAAKPFLIVAVEADITNDGAGGSIGEVLAARDWRVTSLVLNAAQWEEGAAAKTDLSVFSRMCEVNVVASLRMLQLVVQGMKDAKHGAILFNAGIVGVKGFANNSAYCATKHAQIGLAKAWAEELRRDKISVGALITGFIESPRTTATLERLAAKRNGTVDDARRLVEQSHPQRQIVSAEALGALAREFVTGAALSNDAVQAKRIEVY